MRNEATQRALWARLTAVECPAFEARRVARAELAEVGMPELVLASASGSTVTDVDGNEYLDLVGGFGALTFGHRHPPLEAAVDAARASLTMALGDVYGCPEKVTLCEQLAALIDEPGARVLLGASGADALTAALKSALLATGKPGVIAFEASYHGLSHGPLAICGLSAAFRDPFAPHLPGPVSFAPFPIDGQATLDHSLAVVDAALAQGNIGAIVVEPIQGRGGARSADTALLPALRERADRTGALLVVDEIMTGFGRTGATLRSSTLPDLLCVGKALGGGYPISACIGRANVMQAWARHGGSLVHTATHFGAPFAIAAANFVFQHLDPALCARVRQLGERALQPAHRAHWSGQGLLLAVQLGSAKQALAAMRTLAERGVLVITGGAAGDRLTLTPPLTISDAELERALSIVDEVTCG